MLDSTRWSRETFDPEMEERDLSVRLFLDDTESSLQKKRRFLRSVRPIGLLGAQLIKDRLD